MEHHWHLQGVFYQMEVVGACISSPSSPWNSPNLRGCSLLAEKLSFAADFDMYKSF